jgi:Leucine-rich repeat (LRR) protein
VPGAIWSLKNLRFVDLSGNKLEALDTDEESYVLELYAAYNKFSTFPKGIARMSKLEVLDLSNNKIKTLEHLKGPRLKRLSLSGNKLSRFDCKEYLSELEFVDLSYNRLGDCPSELSHSMALSDLNLAFNNLTILPAWLRQSNIKTLDLSGNPYLNLEQAFDIMAQMPQLDTLILREMGEIQFPGQFERLFHLNYLDLSGNQLLDRDIDEIFRRLYRTRVIY